MGKIVKTTDFVGKYKVSQTEFNTADLQAFIDKYELKYLRDLLGVTLANLLYADIASGTYLPPATVVRFITIFNAIAEDSDTLCTPIISDGIKEMLTGFIYWEFVRDGATVNTPTGNVVQENEVSTPADWNSTPIYSVYNEAVKSYRSIQSYIVNNSSDYPEFKGQMKTYNHWAI